MNEIENKPGVSPELAELRSYCAGLQRQSTMLLFGLVVLSFTFVFFVGFQVRRIGKQLDSIGPQAQQMNQAFEKEQPTINSFMQKLVEYSKTHPDFKPVIQKYRIAAAGSSNAPLPAASPAK